MTKDKLKDDIIRTICCLNSDISNKDRNLLIELLNSIVDYTNNFITEFDFRFGPYFIPNKVGTNKKADYNWIKGNNEQDTDKAVRVLLLDGSATDGSKAGSGGFNSTRVRSGSDATVGFFTTVKLD